MDLLLVVGESYELVVEELPSDRSLESVNPGRIGSLASWLDRWLSYGCLLDILCKSDGKAGTGGIESRCRGMSRIVERAEVDCDFECRERRDGAGDSFPDNMAILGRRLFYNLTR
jgi:hypothetical protein